MKQPEKANSPEKKSKKISGRKKIATAFALTSALAACDNMPNNEIRLNPDDQSAKFKVEYKHYEGASSIRIVDYEVVVRKQGETYTGLISEKDGRKGKKTSIESDNIDEIFNEVSRALDSEDVTENTLSKKDDKVDFVKQSYKKHILESENPANSGEIKIKYKSK